MIEAHNQKFVSITPPAAIVDNAGFTTAAIDTLGFRYLTIVVFLGALDIALTVFKLRESDDNSTYSDVTGANYAVDSTLPAATDDNKMFAFQVDLRGRKRFIDLSMTGGDGTAGTYAAVFAVLSRPESYPNTPEARGFAG
jgi:hypothetical protein